MRRPAGLGVMEGAVLDQAVHLEQQVEQRMADVVEEPLGPWATCECRCSTGTVALADDSLRAGWADASSPPSSTSTGLRLTSVPQNLFAGISVALCGSNSREPSHHPLADVHDPYSLRSTG